MQPQQTVLAPGIVNIKFDLRPAWSALNSMSLVDMPDILSGFDPWVYETSRSMTAQQLATNRVLTNYLMDVMAGPEREQEWNDFPHYLERFAGQEPVKLRDEMLDNLADKARQNFDDGEQYSPQALRDDIEVYIGLFKSFDHHEKYVLDVTSLSMAHALLNDPQELHGQALAHMKFMWDEYLTAEWERRLPRLSESVEVFDSMNLRDMTLLEAIRAVTGRDMRNLIDEEYAASINTAIFVPSPHIGPYLTWHRDSAAAWVLFGARMPQQETANGAARLNTFEMLNGVEALADATRLEILQMLAQRGEMSTQEIMDAFELTKSTASRHLRQLSATGLLGERRESGAAKVYHVNNDALRRLLDALGGSLLGGGSH